MPGLLATGLRYPSDVLPLAQGVKITRSVAYFGGADIVAPELILMVWAAMAFVVLGIAWYRQSCRRMTTGQNPVATVLSASSGSYGSSENVAAAEGLVDLDDIEPT